MAAGVWSLLSGAAPGGGERRAAGLRLRLSLKLHDTVCIQQVCIAGECSRLASLEGPPVMRIPCLGMGAHSRPQHDL